MKNLKYLSFIGLALMLVLSSCTMEKRIYMSGYHIEWNKSKQHIDKSELAISDNTAEQNQITTVEADNNITASVDNSIIIPSHKTVSLSKKENIIAPKTKPILETKTVIANKKEFKNKLREFKKNNSSYDDGSGALRGIGWVFLILGFLILLFVSILIGALLMLLGLIFVIAGAKKGDTSPKSSAKPDTSQYVDVVYLKNGGVIRGMIIEQTPNVQIKIQTKDGSIFVYKMDEIEKMAKESSK